MTPQLSCKSLLSLFTFLFFLHWIAPVNEFLKNKILVGSLKFKSLYVVNLNNKRPNSEIKFLKNKSGRIRDVLIHPKGHILLINDERDGGLFKLYKN